MIRTWTTLSLELHLRLILLLLPILVFALYCIHGSTTDSLANKFSRALGHAIHVDSVYDAQRNGPLGPLPVSSTEDHGQAEQITGGDHEEGRRSATRRKRRQSTPPAPTTSLIRQWCTCCPNPSPT